ncbi:MAG TPA: glycosyltransferase family 4 protein [Bryobacteraceae bacterium]|nr:glycosyltransferase family 4 protein [Bryobacteraceae bacterium]
MITLRNGAPPDFHELTYLDLNPDVLQAVLKGQIQSGPEHWIHFGASEKRAVQPPENIPPDWNEARYLRLNPDISAVVRTGAFASGYEHWVRYGRYEGRLGGGHPWSTTTVQNALATASKGLNMFAFRGTGIGLGAAARGYATALRPLLPLHEVTVPWDPTGMEGTEIGLPPHAVNLIHMNPDVLPIFLGRYGRDMLPSRFNVAIWVWELHAGYAHWCCQSKLFNEIWTPSTFSADAIRPVSQTPVYVIPHVVDGLPLPDSVQSNRRDVFQFLYIFDLASTFERKNPLALVRAFRKAFGDRQDVQLILKYHHAEFDAPAVALLERVVQATPNIRTLNQTLPEEEVYALLRSSDCFVSPHRSEGFGLNIAAAMYYGKPVIATGYSGNMDFTTPQNSFLIDYDLVAVQHETGAYKAGYVWAEPSEDHLAALLRTVVESPDQSRERGELGRQTIQDRFSVKAISEIICRRFAEWGL